MAQLNLWAVLVAGVSAFMLGGLWYSPLLFSKIWQQETGIGCGDHQPKHKPAFTFGVAFALSLLSAFVFAMFLGPKPPMTLALGAGFSAGLAWVAASFGINYVFEEKSFRLFCINGGYHTAQFTLYGLVFGLMP
jgi:hypothetical protein